MLNYIKIDLDRTLRSKAMAAAVLAGCVVTVLQILVDVVPFLQYQQTSDFTIFPLTVFEKWIGLMIGGMFPIYYYFFIPIAGAVPCALSMYTDRKTGYVKNVFTRTKKRNYYAAKFVSAFLSAGIVSALPQIVNLLIVALLLPSTHPYPGIGYVGVLGDALWGEIFYTEPYLYIFLYLILDFVLYGLFNTLAVALSWLISNRFAILLIPFMAVMLLEFGTKAAGRAELSAEALLIPLQSSGGVSLFEITALIGSMLAICIVSGVYGILRRDCYD